MSTPERAERIPAPQEDAYAKATDWTVNLGERMGQAVGDMPRSRQTIVEEMRRREGDSVPSDVTGTEGELGGIRVYWVTTPESSDTPVFFFLHTGGFLFGAPELDTLLLSRVARATGGRSVSVDYRLAPEHPYPAAVEDAVAAYGALIEEVSPSQVVVSGDSAGGGLAVLLLQAILDNGMPMPAGAALTSPMLDYGASGETFDTHADKDLFVSREAVLGTAGLWLDGRDAKDVSPIYGRFDGFPPTLIQVGANECFLSEVQLAHQRINDAGGQAQLEIYDDVHHLWHGHPDLTQAKVATERIADFVSARTAGE